MPTLTLCGIVEFIQMDKLFFNQVPANVELSEFLSTFLFFLKKGI